MSEHCTDVTGSVKKSVEGSSGGRLDTFWASAHLTDFYGNVFDIIGVVAMLVDVRGTVRMLNRKAVELTGFSRDAALGKDAFTLLFPPGVQDPARMRLLYGLEDLGEIAGIRLPVLTRDGRSLPVNWSASLVRDDHGAIFGAICVGQPVSEAAYGAGDQAAHTVGTCKCAGDLLHNLLNQNQVAIGYMELAMERQNPEKDHLCLLDRAHKALVRSSDIALDVYRNVRDEPERRSVVIRTAHLSAGKK